MTCSFQFSREYQEVRSSPYQMWHTSTTSNGTGQWRLTCSCQFSRECQEVRSSPCQMWHRSLKGGLSPSKRRTPCKSDAPLQDTWPDTCRAAQFLRAEGTQEGCVPSDLSLSSSLHFWLSWLLGHRSQDGGDLRPQGNDLQILLRAAIA